MMPDDTKKYITQRWGGKSMYVAKDVLAIAFGYRQYSIVDAFDLDSADRHKFEDIIVRLFNFVFKSYGVTVANNLETTMIELTKIAKNNIIVKSALVTVNNFGSNFWYLKSRGVSNSTILRYAKEAITMGTKYQADIQELGQLELKAEAFNKQGPLTVHKQQLLDDLNIKIIQLKDTIQNNPTTKLIEAGLMPSLVDDVETTISGGNFPTPFEKAITDKVKKLPKIIQNVGGVVFLTQDTSAYKVLNNAVKMTDFIGRYVLYQHYTTQVAKSERLNHEEAMAAVIEEFVNFNLPTHRITEYLNSIGILWFSKYGIRILKIMKNAAVDKPFDVLMAIMMSSHVGMDNINNSLPGVTKDLFANWSNSFSTAWDATDSPITLNVAGAIFK